MRLALDTKAALVGGVLSGIGASACCVGPLLFLSLGISGAWIAHLTALEPYRPVFIALTILSLGLAYRRLFLTPQGCAVEGSCVSDRTRKVQRILFWVLAPGTLLLVATPWILPFFYR
jgi:mercuric ion transport protein